MRGSENASSKSRHILHASLRFIFAQAKAPVVSTIKIIKLYKIAKISQSQTIHFSEKNIQLLF